MPQARALPWNKGEKEVQKEEEKMHIPHGVQVGARCPLCSGAAWKYSQMMCKEATKPALGMGCAIG
jgi:hypothetical protein